MQAVQYFSPVWNSLRIQFLIKQAKFIQLNRTTVNVEGLVIQCVPELFNTAVS